MNLRTNPAYAALAYRKAIVDEVINRLRSEYTSAYGGEPTRFVECEDVFKDDAEVPQEEILRYTQDLEQESAELRLELLKFDFVRREEDAPEEGVGPAPAKARRKVGRRKVPAKGGKARGGAGNKS